MALAASDTPCITSVRTRAVRACDRDPKFAHDRSVYSDDA